MVLSPNIIGKSKNAMHVILKVRISLLKKEEEENEDDDEIVLH